MVEFGRIVEVLKAVNDEQYETEASDLVRPAADSDR